MNQIVNLLDNLEYLAQKGLEFRAERSGYGTDFNFRNIFTEAIHSKISLTKNARLEELFDETGRYMKEVNIEDKDYTKSQIEQVFYNDYSIPRSLIREIKYSLDLNEMADNVTHTEKLIGGQSFQEGTKVSRVVRAIIKNFGSSDSEFDRFMTIFSRAMNDRKVKGTLVLSVNPIDFLTMSYGQNWSSCFDAEGEYESGTMSYAIDNRTVLAFLISSSDKDNLVSGKELVLKKWRKVLIFDELYSSILGSKGYPFSSEGLTNEAVSVLRPSLIGSVKRYEETSKYCSTDTGNSSTVYSDISFGNSILTYLDKSQETLKFKFKFGEAYDCLICGCDVAQPESFSGRCCRSSCDSCGDLEVDLTTVCGGDELCDYCLDSEYRYSETHGEYLHESEVIYVESEGDYLLIEEVGFCKNCESPIKGSSNDNEMCEDCIEDVEIGG